MSSYTEVDYIALGQPKWATSVVYSNPCYFKEFRNSVLQIRLKFSAKSSEIGDFKFYTFLMCSLSSTVQCTPHHSGSGHFSRIPRIDVIFVKNFEILESKPGFQYLYSRPYSRWRSQSFLRSHFFSCPSEGSLRNHYPLLYKTSYMA